MLSGCECGKVNAIEVGGDDAVVVFVLELFELENSV